MTDFKVYVGAKIREARRIIGWEQKELAAALHTPIQTVNAWENGKVRIKWEDLQRIARVTGRGLSFFLPGTEATDLAHAMKAMFPGLEEETIGEMIAFIALAEERDLRLRNAGKPGRVPSSGDIADTGGSLDRSSS